MKVPTLDENLKSMMGGLKVHYPEYYPLPDKISLKILREHSNLGVVVIVNILQNLGYTNDGDYYTKGNKNE